MTSQGFARPVSRSDRSADPTGGDLTGQSRAVDLRVVPTVDGELVDEREAIDARCGLMPRRQLHQHGRNGDRAIRADGWSWTTTTGTTPARPAPGGPVRALRATSGWPLMMGPQHGGW